MKYESEIKQNADVAKMESAGFKAWNNSRVYLGKYSLLKLSGVSCTRYHGGAINKLVIDGNDLSGGVESRLTATYYDIASKKWIITDDVIAPLVKKMINKIGA